VVNETSALTGHGGQRLSDTRQWLAAACSGKRDASPPQRRASMTAYQLRIIIVFSRLTLGRSNGSFGRHLIHNRGLAWRPADDGLSWPDTSAPVPFLMGNQERRSSE